MSESASPSGRSGPDHGHTVVDGIVRRTSVSALQLADTSTDAGCTRKWWYAYVQHRKEPQTAAQLHGVRLHGEIEQYLRTGEPRLSDQILKCLHFVPSPGSDLLVEHPLIPVMADGSSGLHLAPLRAAGIPVVGFIDLVDDRRVNVGSHEIEDTVDPIGTVQVTDWKFTGSMDYAKQAHELVHLIQMAGYGKYIFDVVPGTRFVRLSHGYMPGRGRGDKRSALVDRDAVERTWEHAESVARTIIDAAREPDPDKVPANRRACRAFHKLCVHAADGYCTAGTFNSLRSICSATVSPRQLITKDDIMGLTVLQAIRGNGAAPEQTAAPAPVATSVAAMLNLGGAVAAPDPAIAAAAKQAEIDRLKAEEAALKAQRAFADLCGRVAAHGMGFPALGGAAAQLFPQGVPSGQLGAKNPDGTYQLTVSDTDTMVQILVELDKLAADRAAALAGAPAPQPVSQPVQTQTAVAPPPVATSPAPAALPVQAGPTAPALLSAEAPPVSIPQASTAPAPTAPSGQTVVATAPAEAPKKRGRKPKADSAATQTTEHVGNTIDLLIDCVVEDGDATSLHEMIDAVCTELAALVNAADIRCASADSPLGYNKWQGALASRIREVCEKLPPGTYSIDTRGSAIRAIAAESISVVVRASGGRIYRGV